mgnify:CR=1 FL=1
MNVHNLYKTHLELYDDMCCLYDQSRNSKIESVIETNLDKLEKILMELENTIDLLDQQKADMI